MAPAARAEKLNSEPPFGAFAPGPFAARLISIGRSLPSNVLGRRIASLIRSTLSRIRNQPFDLEVLGQRMRLHAGNNACEKRLIVTPQFFDPVELNFIRTQVRPDFRFVDVGANIGAYTVFAARAAGTGGRVLAIDPNSVVLDRLTFNVKINDLSTVTTLNAALGERDGEAEFAIDQANMGRSSLHLDRDTRAGRTLVRVPVRPLQSVLEVAGFRHVDILKIDVEGYEDRVLMPFLEMAPDALLPRAFIIEDSSSEWERDLLGALRDRGYATRYPEANNRIMVRTERSQVK